MPEPVFIPYADRYDPGVPPEQAAEAFYDVMRRRRSVRMFSDKPVSKETIEWIVRSAASAPSGANKQPWRFVAVQDPELKRAIRIAAEEEEQEFYTHRAPQAWLDDLAPLGTDADKGYLEVAPWLVVVFQLTKDARGGHVYYGAESTGIAVGMFLAAAHHAGLATLTHTPSPMKFLAQILGREPRERPFVLIPVGYPADDCVVPEEAFKRRPLERTLIVDRSG